MAVDLTTIYGNKISMAVQPRRPVRQTDGFAGAHGVVDMNHGSRGYPIAVSGVMRVTGATYAIRRAAMMTLLNAIEQYQWLDAASYTYAGQSYDYVVFDRAVELIPVGDGKVFFISGAHLICRFRAKLRGLI